VLLAQRAVHVPPHEPGRHRWAELLKLVDDLRRLAYDRTLEPDDATCRIRDRFGEYHGLLDDAHKRDVHKRD
jgi:hypothetical protein